MPVAPVTVFLSPNPRRCQNGAFVIRVRFLSVGLLVFPIVFHLPLSAGKRRDTLIINVLSGCSKKYNLRATKIGLPNADSNVPFTAKCGGNDAFRSLLFPRFALKV